jgi:hypothetical protein
MSSPKRRPSLLVVVAIALAASLVGGGVATASHQFSDVSNGHPFHADISAIRTAGITAGFDNGTYQPGTAVSRGAMAAFMRRGFGRVASTTDTDSNPGDSTNTNGATVNVRAGAAVGGTSGFVTVTGTANMATPVADCQCILTAEIRNNSTGATGSSRTAMGDDENFFFVHLQSIAVQATFPIPANTTHSYSVRFRVITSGVNTGITVSSDIQATYVPFNGLGNA